MSDTLDGMVSLPEAAMLLKERYNLAYDRLMLGELSGERVGGRWYVTRASIQALLAQRGRRTPSPRAA